MYLQFFGFTYPPFADTPDVSQFWEDHMSRNIFLSLLRGISEGCTLQIVTAEPGLGKSMVCRRLLNTLRAHKTRYDVLYKPFPNLGLGMQSGMGFNKDAQAPHKVILIDEGQLLSTSSLAHLIQMLQRPEQQRQAVLFAQPELLELLQSPDLYGLAEIDTRLHTLNALSETETARYIRARLIMAGGDDDIVQETVTREIHHCTRGVPRLINTVMRKALLHAFEEQSSKIGHQHIVLAKATTAAVAAPSNQ